MIPLTPEWKLSPLLHADIGTEDDEVHVLKVRIARRHLGMHGKGMSTVASELREHIPEDLHSNVELASAGADAAVHHEHFSKQDAEDAVEGADVAIVSGIPKARLHEVAAALSSAPHAVWIEPKEHLSGPTSTPAGSPSPIRMILRAQQRRRAGRPFMSMGSQAQGKSLALATLGLPQRHASSRTMQSPFGRLPRARHSTTLRTERLYSTLPLLMAWQAKTVIMARTLRALSQARLLAFWRSTMAWPTMQNWHFSTSASPALAGCKCRTRWSARCFP